jgi:hypothetical protein
MRSGFIKWIMLISALLFADWVLLVLFGCFSALCKASDKFFCNIYCKAGIALLSVTVILFAVMMFLNNRKQRKPSH